VNLILYSIGVNVLSLGSPFEHFVFPSLRLDIKQVYIRHSKESTVLFDMEFGEAHSVIFVSLEVISSL